MSRTKNKGPGKGIQGKNHGKKNPKQLQPKPKQPVAVSTSPKQVIASTSPGPVAASTSPEPVVDEKKRKRKDDAIPEDEKLEIDVALPEPPSKKAKRAEKNKLKSSKKEPRLPAGDGAKDQPVKDLEYDNADPDAVQPKVSEAPVRSEYGIWIGNLPWSATRETLRQFFNDQGEIAEKDIVRLHLPAPTDKGVDGKSRAQNKGFAYVDFTTQEILDKAIQLSEKLLTGRRVLIKNAKSFEGRPDKPKAGNDEAGNVSKKAPAKRIFVGNLSFDVDKEELGEHFGQAGEVEDIHMATFEDSGKCKGFAWVRFVEVEAAEAAVRGFVYKAVGPEDDGESADDDAGDGKAGRKKTTQPKRHKQHINRLHGRELRCEFAEDAQTRYKKRYGKGANAEQVRDRRDPNAAGGLTEPTGGGAEQGEAATRHSTGPKPDKDQRRDERRKRHERIDARTVAPGQALANAPRNSGAIVAGAGKKLTFD